MGLCGLRSLLTVHYSQKRYRTPLIYQDRGEEHNRNQNHQRIEQDRINYTRQTEKRGNGMKDIKQEPKKGTGPL